MMRKGISPMRSLPVIRFCSLFILPLAVLLSGSLLAGGVLNAGTVGMTTLPAIKASSPAEVSKGPLTVWYPSEGPESSRTLGPFLLKAAWGSAPVRGNGALIALSHGSAGSTLTYHDLARVLVEAGFVVIAPEHAGDNWKDQSKIGPPSWKQRPAEISAAVDRIQSEPGFGPFIDTQRVGVFGMSAGGLTALMFSGASWSLDRLVKHCAAHFEEDPGFCAYQEFTAVSGQLDEAARSRIKERFDQGVQSGKVDTSENTYQDQRVKAVVAAVPVGAVIDPASLRKPAVPTALVSAELDQILTPRWHVLAIQEACKPCLALARVQQGGHMSILSPLPESLIQSLGAWAKNPPGFDKATLIPLYGTIAQFFVRNL
jgi:predicted dienelactone hydrolase